MPNFPWLSSQDAPDMEDASLAALLAGAGPAEGLAPGLEPLADAVAALTARPASDELAGEAAVLAEFYNRVGVPVPASRSRHRRHRLLTPLLSARAAAAAAVAALGLGGFATAAFACALPAPAQQFAHHTFGAPAARGGQPTGTHPSATATPAGPDATGPAAFGLCTAWAHAKAHGTPSQQAVAFRNLAAAAGGASNVAAYCAAVPHPGPSASHTAHPTGPPTSHPTGPPTSHPAGPPTSHPTGPPTSHPTGPPASPTRPGRRPPTPPRTQLAGQPHIRRLRGKPPHPSASVDQGQAAGRRWAAGPGPPHTADSLQGPALPASAATRRTASQPLVLDDESGATAARAPR